MNVVVYCAAMCNANLDNLDAARGGVIGEGNFAQNSMIIGLLAQLYPSRKIFISVDHANPAHRARPQAAWPNVRRPSTLSLAVPSKISGFGAYQAQWNRFANREHLRTR